jgi:hypothetical protein
MKTAFTELFHLNYSVVHLISKNFYYLVPSMDSQGTQHPPTCCIHHACQSAGWRADLQRFRWSVLAKFVSGDENASPKNPHGAYSFPLATRLNSGADIKEMIKNLNNETRYLRKLTKS